ncbi:AAC(3) family N-acetyltransferase [Pontibacillus sp. HN14]|uniref:Aminoglycoside N(3)-acetyltransferase n=1 Tax=Pontibacillus chungwhensis TaxID=265426 RepID=A0ABY8V2Z6_9BACI|nr:MULTISPECIES: AAC(3) family N-acetyltransferase [Pontibacillus]MCD5322349.1 AAC(3) family N-acetyltransferase [Pontibacillus sp. HN14]WIG00163.1 AAC(3) family N-acetyltransferase [Pontibacillus chungwhensis]
MHVSEQGIISQTIEPRTRETLTNDLRDMGVCEGMTVLVHSSLSEIGWTSGGAVAVVQALMDVVTSKGTIVMPAQSGVLSDPAEWENPPVPEDWWETIRNTMPPFDPDTTPTSGMGQIVEVFRSFKGVKRSNHPAVSFVAWGREADFLMANHSLHNGLGESSPLRKLYDQEAHLLFIGTGYDTATAFHLAEYRIPYQKKVQKGAPILVQDERVFALYEDIVYREELFEGIGQNLEKQIAITKGKIGSADSKLFHMKPSVDFAVEWLRSYDQK